MSYEQIVLTFRTLADKSRLRILLLLVCHEELSASDIAEKTGLSPPNTSFHLKMLCASGLVWRHRSGAWIFHSLRASPQGGWLDSLVRAMRDAARDGRVKQLRHRADLASPTVQALLDALFRIATAFTNVRRLLLIKQLRKTAADGPEDLLRAVPMSDRALSRHMDKLTSRGYLRCPSATQKGKLRIPGSFESKVQARVLGAVFEALDLIPSRDSATLDPKDGEREKAVTRTAMHRRS